METMEKTPVGIAQDAIKSGDTGNDVAKELDRRSKEVEQAAKDVQQLRAETAQAIQDIAPDQEIIDDDQIAYLEKQGHSAEVAETVSSAQTPEEAAKVSATLSKTAEDIRASVGAVQNADLDSGVAGQAYQGQGGTSQVDISTALQTPSADGASLVDKTQLDDIKKHEKRHEQQTNKWNAESVDIGGGQTLSRTEVSEWDSMDQQTTISTVSDDYKKIYAKVSGLGMKGAMVEVATKTGDLDNLGKKIRAKRGEKQAQLAA